MKKEIHVMLDIETLSQQKNAVIVSIGAVKFMANTDEIISTFSINIDPKSCLSYGLHLQKETVHWWANQPKETRLSWQSNPKPLPFALRRFLEFYDDNTSIVWSKGICFDIPILENAFRAVNSKEPWKYYEVCDYRTVLKVLGINDKYLKTSGSVYHDALSDAMEQTKLLMPLIQAFEDFEPF